MKATLTTPSPEIILGEVGGFEHGAEFLFSGPITGSLGSSHGGNLPSQERGLPGI